MPRKIRLMSAFLSKQMKEKPNETLFELEIPPYYLTIITDYCKQFDYLKVRSTIQFPAEYNIFQQNVSYCEWQSLTSIENDFEALKRLLIYCKIFNIDALYELTACAIACFFKSRNLMNFPQ